MKPLLAEKNYDKDMYSKLGMKQVLRDNMLRKYTNDDIKNKGNKIGWLHVKRSLRNREWLEAHVKINAPSNENLRRIMLAFVFLLSASIVQARRSRYAAGY